MFISKSFLNQQFEVDPTIAAFFVDRPVPEGNFYWHERLLYVSRGTGFLFIPLYFDLQRRCGVTNDVLLDEVYVRINEKILHGAALHEAEKITLDEHITNCKSIVESKGLHEDLYHDLGHYYSIHASAHKYLGTGNKALNRADSLLFALCALPVNNEIIHQIIECWYALVPSFLLIDDIMDIDEDSQTSQENSVLEFAPGAAGIKMAVDFLEEKIKILAKYNAKLEGFFDGLLQRQLESPFIKSIVLS